MRRTGPKSWHGKQQKTRSAAAGRAGHAEGDRVLRQALEWLNREDIFIAMQLSRGLSDLCTNPKLSVWSYYHAHVPVMAFRPDKRSQWVRRFRTLLENWARGEGVLTAPRFGCLQELLVTHPILLPVGDFEAGHLIKLSVDILDRYKEYLGLSYGDHGPLNDTEDGAALIRRCKALVSDYDESTGLQKSAALFCKSKLNACSRPQRILRCWC